MEIIFGFTQQKLYLASKPASNIEVITTYYLTEVLVIANWHARLFFVFETLAA